MDHSKTDEMCTLVRTFWMRSGLSYSHYLSHAPSLKEAWLGPQLSSSIPEHVFPGVQAAAEGRRGDQRLQEGW